MASGTGPEHTVLASTWFARQEVTLAHRQVEDLKLPHPEPDVVWLAELSEHDLSCLYKRQTTLVPRDGPEAGSNASAAAALAYAEARSSVAVLADLDNVEVALTVSPATRTRWLPALLDRLVRAGLAATEAASMLSAMRASGAGWAEADLLRLPSLQ